MLLDIMDNLPRLRLSSNHFRMILWLLHECGIDNTPSYDAFRKMQKDVGALFGDVTQRYESSIGNFFYVNKIGESIARVSHPVNVFKFQLPK